MQNEISPSLLINILNHHQRSHTKRETSFPRALIFVKTEIVSLLNVNTRLALMRICVDADMSTPSVTSIIIEYMNVQSSLSHSIDFLDVVSSHCHFLYLFYHSSYQCSFISNLMFHFYLIVIFSTFFLLLRSFQFLIF